MTTKRTAADRRDSVRGSIEEALARRHMVPQPLMRAAFGIDIDSSTPTMDALEADLSLDEILGADDEQP